MSTSYPQSCTDEKYVEVRTVNVNLVALVPGDHTVHTDITFSNPGSNVFYGHGRGVDETGDYTHQFSLSATGVRRLLRDLRKQIQSCKSYTNTVSENNTNHTRTTNIIP
jgi:hypothetical protein